ncbi:MAG TPA: RQC domain-containing protein [Chitinophagales bacterium]|nr:RQC domain-containing protein [Chitinophagales bacterium]
MPHKFDATVIAQKILSAVARLKEQYASEYVIDFLMGSKSEKILPEHRLLKTFGAGADLSRQQWLNHLRDLISLGYLNRSSSENSVLFITEKGWRVLNGKEQVWLMKSNFGNKLGVKSTRISRAPDYEPDLLEHLKDVRNYLASKYETEAEEIVPYLKLHQMATYLPNTKYDLQKIAGWDDTRLRSYGLPFLKVILEYLEVNGLETRMRQKGKLRPPEC